MGILGNLKSWYNRNGGIGFAQKSDMVGLGSGTATSVFGVPDAQFSTASFDSIVTKFFDRNELVGRIVRFKADAMAAAPLRIYRKSDDTELPDHPLRKIIERPNPWMSEFDLMQFISMHLDLAGNAFIQKVRNGALRTVQLYPLMPDQIKLKISEEGLVGYEHRVGSQTRILLPEEVIHIKVNDPANFWLGKPPILSLIPQITSDNEATAYASAILQNKGIPSIAITANKAYTQAEVDRDKAIWRQAFGGANRGMPAFLQDGMKIQELGLSLQQLEFLDMRSITESRICLGFGIHPVIMGVLVGLNASTYSNMEKAFESFYETTMEPLWDHTDDAFNNSLVSDFGSDIEARYDTSNLTAYEPKRTAEQLSAFEGMKAGSRTVNEYRAVVGLDPVTDGDIFLRPLNIVQVPAKTTTRKSIEQKFTPGSSAVGLIQAATGRRDASEVWLPQMKAMAKAVFKRQEESVLEFIEKNFPGEKADQYSTDAQIQAIFEGFLTTQKMTWTEEAAMLFAPVMAEVLNEASNLTAQSLGSSFQIDSVTQQAFVKEYTVRLSDKLSQTSIEDIRTSLTKMYEEPFQFRFLVADLKVKFTNWSKYRAEMVARTETIRASNYGALQGYKDAGVEKVEWLKASDACDICNAISEQVSQVNIGDSFFSQGDTIDIGNDKTFTFNYESIEAPPSHPNCRCTLIPVLDED